MDLGLKPNWKALGYSQGIQQVIDRIYLAYQAFFDHDKKTAKAPPRFKPFRRYKSFTLKQAGWKLDEDNAKIKIGKNWYRYNKSRNIEGTPKTLTVKRDSLGDLYIIISCEQESSKPSSIPTTGKIAGFDFGLKSFLTSSDGTEYHSRQFLKSHLKELKIKSKQFSKKVAGSKNQKKARKVLARLHRKVNNKRLDAHYKLALDLIRNYDCLFFENLNLDGMKKLWGRKVSDLGFFSFLKILEFKAQEHQKIVHKVNRFFPSSKKCSFCHTLSELALKDRVFECKACGFKINRDLNAAKNILMEGTSSIGLEGVIPKINLVSFA